MLLRMIVVASCIGLLAVSACSGDPDGNSGGDEDRHLAKDIPIGQAVQGEFSWPSGDRTDWMKFVTEDGGLMRIEVSFTNKDTGATVQVFNSFGKPVTKEFVKRPGQEENLNIENTIGAGRHFIRVRGAQEGDKSEYSLRIIVQ